LPKASATGRSRFVSTADQARIRGGDRRLQRYLFWGLWFVLVPAVLASIAVWVLRPADAAGTNGPLGGLRWFVYDQPIPAGILLFTLFEMALYHFRHSLPLAGIVGIGGRVDLPREVRRDYEQAAQLLDESERILKRQRVAVERDVTLSAREELNDALDDLRETMENDRFDEQRFAEAQERAQKLVARHLGRWQKGELREYAESIGIAVAVALLLRAFVVEAFKIPSGSMLPTLQIQDHIFVNKFAYGPTIPFTKVRLFHRLPPKYGDVMVFEFPDPNPANPRQDFIKRVIALEGDTLMVDSGHPVINGWRVPSCRVGSYDYFEGDDHRTKRGELFVEYLGEYSYLTLYEDDRSEGPQGPYKAKPGEVWVLGDNRNNSSDSRAWFGYRGGGVPYANIKGRAMFVWMSFGPDGGVTWDRLGSHVLGKPRLPKGAPSEIDAAINRCLVTRPPIAKTTPPPAL